MECPFKKIDIRCLCVLIVATITAAHIVTHEKKHCPCAYFPTRCKHAASADLGSAWTEPGTRRINPFTAVHKNTFAVKVRHSRKATLGSENPSCFKH